VTLNDVTVIILCYFTEFDSFGGRLHHRGWRYNVCRISSSTIPSSQNWSTLQRGLSATAALLVQLSHKCMSVMQLNLLNVQSLTNYSVATNTKLQNITQKVHSLFLAAGVCAHPCAPSPVPTIKEKWVPTCAPWCRDRCLTVTYNRRIFPFSASCEIISEHIAFSKVKNV